MLWDSAEDAENKSYYLEQMFDGYIRYFIDSVNFYLAVVEFISSIKNKKIFTFIKSVY